MQVKRGCLFVCLFVFQILTSRVATQPPGFSPPLLNALLYPKMTSGHIVFCILSAHCSGEGSHPEMDIREGVSYAILDFFGSFCFYFCICFCLFVCFFVCFYPELAFYVKLFILRNLCLKPDENSYVPRISTVKKNSAIFPFFFYRFDVCDVIVTSNGN